jgi:hypothetical protein
MSDPTPAQEEFARFVSKNSGGDTSRAHPEDRDDERRERDTEEVGEEDAYRNSQIDAAMRIPTFTGLTGSHATPEITLPPASFDAGRTTGVKGVIADARAYELARRSKWMNRVRAARRSVFGVESHANGQRSAGESETDEEGSHSDVHDEEAFLQQWRESRRRELESEANRAIRNRRTSPSVRVYGRLDEVDALGYLDAIEKVGRETVVIVFVYDHEVWLLYLPQIRVECCSHTPQCPVSATIESAMMPLVGSYPTAHFVKVHYEDIEFDNAGVPAILAYRNQGDLFANLTGIIEMIPDDEIFGTDSLRRIFQKHQIL